MSVNMYDAANMYDAWDCGDRPAIREQLKQREDIIRMAREAGMPPAEIVTDTPVVYPTPESLERFADLVRDYLLSTEIHSCHPDCERFACVQTRKAVEAEREACARVCEEQYEYYGYDHVFAAAIRARGQA